MSLLVVGRLLVVGDVMTDVLAVLDAAVAVGTDTPARITMTGGGSAANTAVWLADLGVPVTLVSVMGTDPAGTDRLDELRAAGVDCAIRRTRDAPTGTVVVLSRAGERSMVTDRGANAVCPLWTLTPCSPRRRTRCTCTCPGTCCWTSGPGRPASTRCGPRGSGA